MINNQEKAKEIPSELYAVEALFEDKNTELRISENFLLFRVKKGFMRSEKVTLINLNEVKWCYYSHTVEYKNCIAGFIYKTGEVKELTRIENSLTRMIFEAAERVVQGFEKYGLSDENPLKYIGEEYKISDNRLIFSKNGKEKVIIDDLSRLSACEQSHSTGGCDDDHDNFNLWLYTENDKKSECIEFISAKNCFLTAVALKQYAPQLKYR